MERKELRAAIGEGLQALSEEHRQVLVVREISGLSYAEIGPFSTGKRDGQVQIALTGWR